MRFVSHFAVGVDVVSLVFISRENVNTLLSSWSTRPCTKAPRLSHHTATLLLRTVSERAAHLSVRPHHARSLKAKLHTCPHPPSRAADAQGIVGAEKAAATEDNSLKIAHREGEIVCASPS
eukprot:scaffold4899_cov135-Isochrysis_galbana.AAC.1